MTAVSRQATTEDLGDYFELKSLGHHNHLMLVVRVS